MDWKSTPTMLIKKMAKYVEEKPRIDYSEIKIVIIRFEKYNTLQDIKMIA